MKKAKVTIQHRGNQTHTWRFFLHPLPICESFTFSKLKEIVNQTLCLRYKYTSLGKHWPFLGQPQNFVHMLYYG